eukprot:2075751-Lingulodinium_polyedra.AAC.1
MYKAPPAQVQITRADWSGARCLVCGEAAEYRPQALCHLCDMLLDSFRLLSERRFTVLERRAA